MKALLRIYGNLIFVTVLILGIVVLTHVPIASAGDTITLRAQSAFGRGNGLFKAGEHFAFLVGKYTDGRVKIKFNAAGEIVPSGQVLEAARQGLLDAGQGCPCVARSKAYAAQWYCDVPNGQSPMEEIIWYYKGGGKEIFEDLIHKYYKAHPVMMQSMSTEVWLYSNSKIKTVEDLKGLKMRAAGMRGEVLTSMGASVVVLSGGEIVPALERGVIDAMEMASLNSTFPLGFCDVTKYLYMHPKKSTSPATFFAFNLKVWNKLPKDIQAAIEKAGRHSHLYTLTQEVMEDTVALKHAVEKQDSEILFLPLEVAEAVDKAAAKYYEEKAKTNQDLARVLRSWNKFKKDYGPYAKWIDNFNYTGDTLAPFYPIKVD